MRRNRKYSISNRKSNIFVQIKVFMLIVIWSCLIAHVFLFYIFVNYILNYNMRNKPSDVLMQ